MFYSALDITHKRKPEYIVPKFDPLTNMVISWRQSTSSKHRKKIFLFCVYGHNINTSLSRDRLLSAQRNLQVTLLNNPHHDLILVGLSLGQTPLSYQFTNLFFLCLKVIASWSDHFLESSISCEDSHIHVKIQFVYFSPVSLSLIT